VIWVEARKRLTTISLAFLELERLRTEICLLFAYQTGIDKKTRCRFCAEQNKSQSPLIS